jgi:hypothetical protein
MNEETVKIIKLPTMGQPLSYKTWKQGRRSNIDNDIKRSNESAKRHLNNMVNENSTNLKRIKEFFSYYKPGKNSFLDSIHYQIRKRGFEKLSKCQIGAIKKTLNIT